VAIAMHQISPVAHWPLVLGVIRKLDVAALIDTFCPPHPGHILSYGRGVEALLLAMLDGHHALYKVGARLEECGMLPMLQEGLTRSALHDYRLGQILDGLFAANLGSWPVLVIVERDRSCADDVRPVGKSTACASARLSRVYDISPDCTALSLASPLL
jgi:uncharacterized protein DUF4277